MPHLKTKDELKVLDPNKTFQITLDKDYLDMTYQFTFCQGDLDNTYQFPIAQGDFELP